MTDKTSNPLWVKDKKEGMKMRLDGRSKLKMAASLSLVFCMIVSLVACGSNSGQGVGEDASLVIATYSTGRCFMDPHKTTDYGDYDRMNQVYDTLVTADFDGSTIKGSLADSWEISENGLSYTFHLKDQVMFHSGKSLTSEDVKYTYDRWRDPKTASATFPFVAAIKSIETPDNNTVVINLSRPDPNLLINLTVPVAAILNKDTVEQAEADGKVYGTEVIDGTGPFIFKEFVENDHISFMRNDDYVWGPEIYENKGPAHVKELSVRYLPEAGTRMMEFQAGNIDIFGNGCVVASELNELEKKDFVGVERFTPPYPVFVAFQLNNVSDVIVRQACNMAVDREEIIHTVMADTCDPLFGPLPANNEWYWKGTDNYYEFNIEAANQLLEDSGYRLSSDGYRYKDGKQLGFDLIFSNQENRMAANLLQAQMKKIGLNINLDESHYNDFWDYINSNEFDAMVFELYINTPEDMLYEYMSSNNIPYPNRQGYSKPQTDEWLDAAKITMDREERQALYDKIQEECMATAMFLPMYNRNGFIVYNNRVKGFRAHPTIVEGMPKLLDVQK